MQVKSSIGTERTSAVELILEDIPGGGVVAKADFPTTDTVMKEGALLGVDANGIYHVIKTVAVNAIVALDATSFIVPNGSALKVGDILTNTAKTVTTRAITAIAASGTAYQTVTIADAFGVALAASDVLIRASATGASGTATVFAYTPVAIATNPVDLTVDNTGCGLLVRGRVNESLLPYPVDAAIKALLPLIRFRITFKK